MDVIYVAAYVVGTMVISVFMVTIGMRGLK